MNHPLLGREEHHYKPGQDIRVLVTGAGGSIGNALPSSMFIKTDVTMAHAAMDVLDPYAIRVFMEATKPEVILHLAADKHAPRGEEDPFVVARVNIEGTENIVKAASDYGARVVLASTCKAVEPETVYGASKLIAERIVLNAGGTVARLFNVIESSRNVFAIWEKSARDEGVIRATHCRRYFITLREAVGFISWACGVCPAGRYLPDPGSSVLMTNMAVRWARAHQDECPLEIQTINRRRGDRLTEPFCGKHEVVHETGIEGIYRVTSPHDEAWSPSSSLTVGV